MKIFISDLHISSPLFKKEDKIVSLFNNPDVDEIYILGDLLDTWEEDPFLTAQKKSELIDLINNSGKVVLIIKGNHDPSIEDMKKIFNNVLVLEYHEMELFGKKVILVHGDEVDQSTFFTKLLFPFHYISERIGFNLKYFVRNIYVSFIMWKNKLKPDSLVLNMEKELVNKYCDNYNIIISGHTHLPKIVKTHGIIYVNCGSAIKVPSYVVVEKNVISLRRL